MSRAARLKAIARDSLRRVERKAALKVRRIQYHAKRARDKLLAFIQITYPDYLVGWVHELICKHLEEFEAQVIARLSPRLIISMPPRAGKTFIVAERFPVWYMGRNPGHEIMACSYSQGMANKSSAAARAVVAMPIVADVFPSLGESRAIKSDTAPVKRAKQAKDRAGDWAVESGSSYYAAGVGGGVSGRGAHVLIIDDALKGAAEASSATHRNKVHKWYKSDALTRLAPGGGVIVMATRWHDDDLTGRLLDLDKLRDTPRWTQLILPAIAEEREEHREIGEALHPARFNEHDFKLIREDMKDEAVWNALYQCRPTPSEGLKFKRFYWNRFPGRPKDWVAQAQEICLTVDCANEEKREAARSMIHVMGRFKLADGVKFRILDEWSGQVELPELVAAFRMMVKRWPKATVKFVEYAANGIGLVQSTKDIPGVIKIYPRGDSEYPGGSKEDRAQHTLRALQAGQLELPEEQYTQTAEGIDWAEAIIDEHCAFPKGKYKDRVDTISQVCIRWLTEAKPSGVEAARQMAAALRR